MLQFGILTVVLIFIYIASNLRLIGNNVIKVKKEGIILSKTMLDFEHEGVLNPAAIRDGEFVHIFYRATAKGNYSSIGYCKLKGPLLLVERSKTPVIYPEFDYESHGVEDPRIVKIDGLYYLTYTAYDGVNSLGALATSSNLQHFEKHGLIVPRITHQEFDQLTREKSDINEKYLHYSHNKYIPTDSNPEILIWDKNLIFFPRRINGNLCFLHRIKPDIQIVVSIKYLDELTPSFWHDYFLHFAENIVLFPKYEHELSYIGGGCPPIETADGWLVIYHGVRHTNNGYIYSACAALLNLDDPKIEIARLPYPLFWPEQAWELKGEVNNVCFPTGAAVFDDRLYIYYGAADERIACASLNFSDLLFELLNISKKNE